MRPSPRVFESGRVLLALGLELKPQMLLTASLLCEVHLTRANSQVSELGSGSSSLSPAFR